MALLLRRAASGFGAEFDEEEKCNLFLATGEYFQASRSELEGIRASGIPWDEIPVVLHVSRHTGVGSCEVAALRRSGRSWHDIISVFSLCPESFHVPIETPADGPGANWESHIPETWDARTSSDEDIINLVNLRFISGHYAVRPETVIALHASGWKFSAIHAEMTGSTALDEFSPENGGISVRVNASG